MIDAVVPVDILRITRFVDGSVRVGALRVLGDLAVFLRHMMRSLLFLDDLRWRWETHVAVKRLAVTRR